MISLAHDALFTPALWDAALEKYALVTHLTVQLFDVDARLVLGPIHPTPLFQLFDEKQYDPDIFAQCASRCLAQTDAGSTVIVSQVHGLTTVGTPLMLDGQIVGAAVGGYVFADFAQVSDIQILVRHAGIAFSQLWEVVRQQSPVPQRRLLVHGELLQVLGDALLREQHRARQYEQAAAIINGSDDAIISKNIEVIITSWNDGAERLFGYTAGEMIDRSCAMLIPTDRFEEEQGILARIQQESRSTIMKPSAAAKTGPCWTSRSQRRPSPTRKAGLPAHPRFHGTSRSANGRKPPCAGGTRNWRRVSTNEPENWSRREIVCGVWRLS